MAMLIGREREQALLRAAEEADRSQLVAVYGRLRVGKTFLIHETFRNGFAFQHTGVYGESRARQLAAFSHSLKDAGLAYDTPVPTNWFEAFQQLKSVINASTLQKKVVLLDELSWMDTPKSSTMQAFEYFWNSWASARNDVLLILCSSASSWMLDKVVHDTGGLYHRLNRQIHLRPSPLTWCKCYADANQLGLSDPQIVELYMVLGGIPAYWSLLQRGHSVSQSLDLLFFDTKAPLAREHDLLLASLFRRPEPYRKIVGALSRRKKGLTRSEILEATGIADTGAFSKQLEHLESCGLIRAYKAFGKRKKDSLFQLMDPSILFHYRFLGSRPHDPHYWTHHLLHPAISSWRDLAFKQVCLMHVDEMKRKLGISGVFTKPSSFVCRADPELGTQGSQIDLVLWRADRVINLFEMKYTDGLLTIDRSLDADLRRRASDFSHGHQMQGGNPLDVRDTLRTRPQRLRGKRSVRSHLRRPVRKTVIGICRLEENTGSFFV